MKASHALDIDGLNAVLRTALDATVVMDTDGVIRGWNAIAARTFGHLAEDVMGKRMSEVIVPPRYREAHEKGLVKFLATGDGPVLDQHLEIEGLHANGAELPIELSITHTDQFGQPLFIGFLRDISERRQADETRQVMVDELNHRVKNLLGVVSGLAHQTLKSAQSLEQFGKDFTGRLAALGRSHEILTAVSWGEASLLDLVNALTEPYAGSTGRTVIDGQPLLLPSKHFLALTMIIYELLTNAIKYGAFSDELGRLEIAWAIADGQVQLDWREVGIGASAPPTRKGFGTRMIEFSACHDLAGEARWTWLPSEMVFKVRFPHPGS
jgi:PAS domain S-box-containing protein